MFARSEPPSSKRHDVRYAFRLPVQLTYGRTSRSLMTEDVSYRGVFIRTDAPPPERRLVRLTVVPPNGGRALIVHGMSVHVVAHGNHHGRTPGVGIQFYGLDRPTRQAWEQFIAELEQRDQPIAPDQARLSLPEGVPDSIRRRFVGHMPVLTLPVGSMDALRELVQRDLSQGETLVESEEDLPVGTPVLVQIPHPERADTFLLEGVVQRAAFHARGAFVGFRQMHGILRVELADFVHGGVFFDDPEVEPA